MYAAPPVIQTEVFTTLPKELHNTEKYSPWVAERRARSEEHTSELQSH